MKNLNEIFLAASFMASIITFVLLSAGFLNPQKRIYNGIILSTTTIYLVILGPSQNYIMGTILITGFWLIVLWRNLVAWRNSSKKGVATPHIHIYRVLENDGSGLIPAGTREIVVDFTKNIITFVPNSTKEPMQEDEPRKFKKILRYLNSIKV